MPDQAPKKSKKPLVLALIFLLPLVPAVIVQTLVRRSPPGESITATMSEILAAMQALPQPREGAPATTFTTTLAAGEHYRLHAEVLRTRPGGAAERRVIELEIEVTAVDGESARVRMRPASAMEGKDDERLRFELRWDRDGFLADVGESLPPSADPRDYLLKELGVILPGPFPEAVPDHAWLSPPGKLPSLIARERLDEAKARLGREEMPHRGGLRVEASVGSLRPFRVLGYRRFAIERDEKVGVYECVQRGLVTGRDGALAPLEAELRIIEHMRIDGREEEYLTTITETITRIDGDDER